MEKTTDNRLPARELLDFIDASPSPWHAVATLETHLRDAGFAALGETDAWQLAPGFAGYVVRGGSSLVAFRVGHSAVAEQGFRIIGAHTDSPGLRLKPNAPHKTEGLFRLGVEIYGSPILATFSDRDLSLAGRVSFRTETGVSSELVRFDEPLARIPNLAIHLNRSVNDDGLKLHKQNELPLVWTLAGAEKEPVAAFRRLLAEKTGQPTDALLSFEMNAYDTQAGALWGAEQEFIADSQIDNLSSCWAGLTALLASRTAPHTAVAAFFDHEEIGSETAEGAAGTLMADVLQRISESFSAATSDFARARARSVFVSADAAHAFHPNFPSAYEPLHAIGVNQGPVIKRNSNRRYATDGVGAARFQRMCEALDIPVQTYAHRTDLGCGSTIGPISAARLGIATIDVGCPMWAMHSIRESAGALDQDWLARALTGFFDADAFI